MEIYREITPDADKFPKEKLIDFIETMKEHFDTVKDIDTLASTVFAPYEIKEECIDKIKELNVVNLISEFKNRLETLEPFDKDSVLALIKEVGKALQIKGRNL